ncbi:unnamed protein product, partial [Mesorhabditis belari]|uniref:Uncharacterized protein n=1 Tax=Mesorhabditis belari TaxID=2138241 RepID=A0AAF3EJ95_9BILA
MRSPSRNEISNTELDAIVEDLNNEALTEMNHKIGVLKVICEQVSDKDEKQKHCIALYEEYITWCEARIDAQMVIHFVNRFHDECSAYLLLYHKIEVNIKRYEDELLCRNDNSQRTDAQNLKQKVLRRRKSNPLKKCLCSQKGERVLTELLKEDFEKVIGSKRITDEEIAKLIELSKSRWEFFFSTLQKYDRYCELRELMNRIFVKQWIDVISLLPNQGFAQADILNHYRNACDTLELSIPNEKHSTLITVLEEYYKHKEEERVLEELLKRATTSQEARKSQTSEFYY